MLVDEYAFELFDIALTRGAIILGIVLLAVGVILLLSSLVGKKRTRRRKIFAAVIMVLGLLGVALPVCHTYSKAIEKANSAYEAE